MAKKVRKKKSAQQLTPASMLEGAVATLLKKPQHDDFGRDMLNCARSAGELGLPALAERILTRLDEYPDAFRTQDRVAGSLSIADGLLRWGDPEAAIAAAHQTLQDLEAIENELRKSGERVKGIKPADLEFTAFQAAKLLAQCGQFDSAQQVVQHIDQSEVLAGDQVAETYAGIGREAAKQQDLENADRALDLAIDALPESEHVWRRRCALQAAWDLAASVGRIDTAIEFAEEIDHLSLLAVSLCQHGNDVGAIQAWERQIAVAQGSPNTPDSIASEMAHVALDQARNLSNASNALLTAREAFEFAKQWRDEPETYDKCLDKIFRSLFDDREFHDLLRGEMFEMFGELTSEHKQLQFAELFVAAGQLDQARQLADAMLASLAGSRHPDYHHQWLAEMYCLLGDIDSAHAHFERALAITTEETKHMTTHSHNVSYCMRLFIEALARTGEFGEAMQRTAEIPDLVQRRWVYEHLLKSVRNQPRETARSLAIQVIDEVESAKATDSTSDGGSLMDIACAAISILLNESPAEQQTELVAKLDAVAAKVKDAGVRFGRLLNFAQQLSRRDRELGEQVFQDCLKIANRRRNYKASAYVDMAVALHRAARL